MRETIDGTSYKVHITYICDRKKCENCSAPDRCRHTHDISHAVNYNTQPPIKTLHKKFKGNKFIMNEPVIFYEEIEDGEDKEESQDKRNDS